MFDAPGSVLSPGEYLLFDNEAFADPAFPAGPLSTNWTARIDIRAVPLPAAGWLCAAGLAVLTTRRRAVAATRG